VRRWRWRWRAAVTALAAALTGCGDPGAARATGQELADRVFPGELTVVASRSLGMAGPGHLLTAAVRADPDAAVVFPVYGRDDCGPGSECEQRLRAAVPEAMARAAELRALLGAFASCGYPVVAVPELGRRAFDTVGLSLWVSARVADGAVDALVADLDRCIGAWTAARAAGDSPWRARRASLTLGVADPAVVAAAPAPDPELPTAARLAEPDLVRAVAARPAYSAVMGVPAGGPAPAVGPLLRPVLDVAAQEEFAAAVEAAAAEFLAGTGVTAGELLATGTRLEPGSASRLRAYVRACSTPPPPGRRCSDLLVALTVDRDGGAAADPVLLRDVADGDGRFRYPIEQR
jgi:hypothetical protein